MRPALLTGTINCIKMEDDRAVLKEDDRALLKERSARYFPELVESLVKDMLRSLMVRN